MLNFLQDKQHTPDKVPYSTFHLLWVIAGALRSKYGVNEDAPFSVQRSLELANTVDDWMPPLYSIANSSAGYAVHLAQGAMGPDFGHREFFRNQRGIDAKTELKRLFGQDMERERGMDRDPARNLPM